MLDKEGRAREDLVDLESGEYILEKGKEPSLEAIERVGTLRLELVDKVLEKLDYNLSIDTYLYSFLEESILGREVVSILFSTIGEEDYRYPRLVGLLG